MGWVLKARMLCHQAWLDWVLTGLPGWGGWRQGRRGRDVLGAFHVHVTAARLRVPPLPGKVGCTESLLGRNGAPC